VRRGAPPAARRRAPAAARPPPRARRAPTDAARHNLARPPRRVLLAGLAIWSLATAGTALAAVAAAPLAVIVAGRLLLGLASSCAMPTVTAISSTHIPPGRRASSVASIYALFNVGGVVGLALTPLVADALGWPAAFGLSGALGLAWAAGGAAWVRRLPPPRPAPAPPPAADGPPARPPAGGARSAWVQVAVLCYAHASIGWGFFILQNWVPLYVSHLGITRLSLAGALSSLPWLAAAAAAVAAGALADWLLLRMPTVAVRRRMHTLCTLGCAASFVPLALSPCPHPALAIGCLTANLAFYAFSYGGFHAYLQDVAREDAGTLQAR